MKKIICGLAMVAAMGTAVLLTGCEKKFTATIKNSLPQEFTYYLSNGESVHTVSITEAVVSEVGVTGADIHIKGEVTSDKLDGIWPRYSVGCKVYDSNGEEKYSNGESLEADDNGVIDCTVNVNLGIEADDYIIEFCDYYSDTDIDIELDD